MHTQAVHRYFISCASCAAWHCTDDDDFSLSCGYWRAQDWKVITAEFRADMIDAVFFAYQVLRAMHRRGCSLATNDQQIALVRVREKS